MKKSSKTPLEDSQEPQNIRMVIDKSVKPIDIEQEEVNLKKHQIDLEHHMKKVEHF
tara:strand:- start:127 stop:294 length:168 start_codon:yes stop_codon:yes gene_type:complete